MFPWYLPVQIFKKNNMIIRGLHENDKCPSNTVMIGCSNKYKIYILSFLYRQLYFELKICTTKDQDNMYMCESF
jgi:hypothetical protein